MADEIHSSRITLSYNGSLAQQGEMFFYEFSRATYGASRLLTTIEIFRRTGRVAKRISSKNYIPLVIRAPERGSFPIDILVPIALQASQVVSEYDIPVGEFLKYIIHLLKRLLPKDEKIIVELAKLELRREKERTKQTAEETKRLGEVRKIVESGNANTSAAIRVLQKSMASTDQRITAVGATQEEMARILQQLREQRQRQRELDKYQRQLDAIGEDKLIKLATQVRPQLAEVGLPLRSGRSAKTMALQIEGHSFARFDEESIKDINSRNLDESDTNTTMRLFAYDRDSGHGKCDLPDLGLTKISFGVPVNLRTRLRPSVVAALNEDVVEASVRFFRNRNKAVTSLLINSLELN